MRLQSSQFHPSGKVNLSGLLIIVAIIAVLVIAGLFLIPEKKPIDQGNPTDEEKITAQQAANYL